jgi:hypothetical protein
VPNRFCAGTPGATYIEAIFRDGTQHPSAITYTSVASFGAVLSRIDISNTSMSVREGNTVDALHAQCTYSNGGAIECRDMVTWVSTDPTVARAANCGSYACLQGLRPGSVKVTASLSGITSSNTADCLVVSALGAPTISYIQPAVATAGGTVTIAGDQFSTILSENVVKDAAGVPLTVVNASLNTITVQVGATTKAGPVTVQVRTNPAIATSKTDLFVRTASIASPAAGGLTAVPDGADPGWQTLVTDGTIEAAPYPYTQPVSWTVSSNVALIADLGAVKTLRAVGLTFPDSVCGWSVSGPPSQLRLSVSNDKSTWTEVTVMSPVSVCPSSSRTIAVNAPAGTTGRYFRLLMTPSAFNFGTRSLILYEISAQAD